MEKTLTDRIYDELVDGLEKDLDWTSFIAKHKDSKGPLYNAIGRFFHDMEPKIKALGEVQAKLDAAGLNLDSMDRRIKEAENNIAALEEKKSVLDEQVGVVETKLAQKSELATHLAVLEKLGFDIERIRQLQEALKEIGMRHGLKGRQAVSKFFDDLKDYEAVLGAESLLKGLQTQIETKKLEAGNWQAKEEALRRKHNDLTEDIAAVHALRAKGIKKGQIPVWQRILSRFETIEQFDKYLSQYTEVTKLLNARKEEAESYELRVTKTQSQLETLEKERAKIEGAIESLTEVAEKQLKTMVAREIKEIQAVGQEVRKEFGNLFAQLDALAEKVFALGQKWEGIKQGFQKYGAVKDTLESHAVASEEAAK